ncbi:MAG: uroporphyrinogen decarboxylase family protein [Armatimonadetes bacterium]|nr:uroporphyrinogen decarboxylase family protein [Armatimonadota bacterium]
MTGYERIHSVLSGRKPDRMPVLPILHTGLAPLCGVPLGRFFTDAKVMAGVMAEGFRRFGYDGIQLSMGVTGEAEALGAEVAQPENGSPLLRQRLLADPSQLETLRQRDPLTGGRMPLFFKAVAETVQQAGEEAFVIATMRGPLIAASQLRGVEQILIDMVEEPDMLEAILDFTAGMALRLGKALRCTGAQGLILGEATCSPNFISPAHYRSLVLPRHRRLIAGLQEAGWEALGLHICGNTLPILEDVISTGITLFDIDYQVDAVAAARAAAGRVTLRGNLDPSSALRFGSSQSVYDQTKKLCSLMRNNRWIAGSGCDVPPGTSAANLTAMVAAAQGRPMDARGGSS